MTLRTRSLIGLNSNSPLLAMGMNIGFDLFLPVGATQ